MNRRSFLVLSILASSLSLLLNTQAQSADTNWPQWRGTLGTGEAVDAKPPIKWDENTNIKWQVKIPGDGTSTPIIWKDQIFVQTAVPSKGESATEAGPPNEGPKGKGPPDGKRPPEFKGPPDGKGPPPFGGKGPPGGKGDFKGGFAGKGPPGGKRGGLGMDPPTEPYQFTLVCLDKNSGKTLWSTVCREEIPHEGFHPADGSFAAGSAMTDGEHVYAFFGSRGLFCLDMNGKVKWEKDLGNQRTRNGFGEGSTPGLFGNTIVVTWDHEEEDFIVALDKRTGQELWRQTRDEPTTWATPLIVEHNGQAQVIAPGTNKLISYDLATGKTVWETEGLTLNAIPMPVTANGIVYATAGYQGNKLLAIKLGGSGDITGTDSILWRVDRDTPYVPTPLISGNRLYYFKGNNAQLTCLDIRTGKPHYSVQRIEGLGSVYASPVAAGGHVYIVGRGGTTVVIKDSDNLEIVSTNVLNDPIDASPAIVGNQLFLRSRKTLYCIAEK